MSIKWLLLLVLISQVSCSKRSEMVPPHFSPPVEKAAEYEDIDLSFESKMNEDLKGKYSVTSVEGDAFVVSLVEVLNAIKYKQTHSDFILMEAVDGSQIVTTLIEYERVYNLAKKDTGKIFDKININQDLSIQILMPKIKFNQDLMFFNYVSLQDPNKDSYCHFFNYKKWVRSQNAFLRDVTDKPVAQAVKLNEGAQVEEVLSLNQGNGVLRSITCSTR